MKNFLTIGALVVALTATAQSDLYIAPNSSDTKEMVPLATAGNDQVYAVYFANGKVLYCDKYELATEGQSVSLHFSMIKAKDYSVVVPEGAPMVLSLTGGLSIAENADGAIDFSISNEGNDEVRIYMITQKDLQGSIILNDESGTVLYSNQVSRTWDNGELGARVSGDVKYETDPAAVDRLQHTDTYSGLVGYDPVAGPKGHAKIYDNGGGTYIIKCYPPLDQTCFWLRVFNPVLEQKKW